MSSETLADRNAVPNTGTIKALTARLTQKGLRGRKLLKRVLYSQMALRSAVMIMLGKEQPVVQFTVEADPPSLYWVYKLRPELVPNLAEKLGLPPGFELVPIRCLEGDEPEYLLTLNVYRVSGLANGIRAEWSVYVADPEGGVPRYLVVGAASSEISMDPVDIITPKSRVEHERIGDETLTQVGEAGSAFNCTATMSNQDNAVLAQEFKTANDYIYWGNGIRDRTFYDSGMADPAALALDPETYSITDDTGWADLVEPEPMHVIAYLEAISFVVSPWENVDTLEAT